MRSLLASLDSLYDRFVDVLLSPFVATDRDDGGTVQREDDPPNPPLWL